MNDLLNCQCETKFSIEKHGENHVLYLDRCMHKHGLNLFTISDVAHNYDLESIVNKLNCEESKAEQRIAELEAKLAIVEQITFGTSLNEIKAAAIEEALDNVDWHCGLSPESLLDYAKQLRGEK